MKTTKLSALLFVLAFLLISGCGGNGGKEIGSSVDSNLPPAATAGRASMSGTVYAPSGVSSSRVAARSAAVNTIGRDNKISGATVAVYRMRNDGTLESIGSQYTATTDANGVYTIKWVPQEENLVLVATLNMTIAGNAKTLNLKKVASITDTDVTAQSVTGVDMDVASTLTAKAMGDIVTTANQGLADSEKVTGADLPCEKIDELETEVQTALAADQAATTPAVNLVNAVTDGDTAAASALTSLEDSSNGASLKNKKAAASTQGSVRVKVLDKTNNNKLQGATVKLTLNGTLRTKTTDDKGEAWFDGYSKGDAVEVEVTKQGFKLVKTSGNVEKAAAVHNVVVQMEQVSGNQSPIAKAGVDQKVLQNVTVTLDGSQSYDPDEDTITYAWTQTSGATVTLSSSTAASPTFTAAAAGPLVFSLAVSDGTATSEADTVTITVGGVVCSADTDCNDFNPLTIDSCASAGTTQSACSHATITCLQNSDCNDSNASTDDICLNGGTSTAACSNIAISCTSDADCDDGNPLTLNACLNPGTSLASCTSIPFACNTDTDCNDNNVLTLDTCTNGATANAACSNTSIACNTDTDCDDGNRLTLDTCTNAGTNGAICSNTSIDPSSCDVATYFTNSGKSLEKYTVETIVFDADGDGDQDLFLARQMNYYDGSANVPDILYLNDGAGNFTNSGQIFPDTTMWTMGVCVGDINGDNFPDIITVHYGGDTVQIFHNDGTGNFTLNTSTATGGYPYDCYLNDLDNDGDNDLIFPIHGSGDLVWLNDGTGTFTDSAQSLGSTMTFWSDTGDVDGDGDIDYLQANYGLGPGTPEQVWLNDGNGIFTDSGQLLGGNIATLTAKFGDVDGDGDLDFISGTHLGEANNLWINDGTGTYTLKGALSSYGVDRIEFGDVDNDGDLDVMLVGSLGGPDLGELSKEPNNLYINDGAGNYTLGQTWCTENETHGVSLGDLDGDGDLDVVFGHDDVNGEIWFNTLYQ